MTFKPSVLCPIDFSESSRGALRYAAMIAGHCGSSLTLLAVNDPVFVEAAELTGGHAHLADETRREMERFHRQALGKASNTPVDLHFEIASGKPAPEILRVARERRSDLIVMASHGSTGFRKLFFGSTTERVLRETGVPVLVTPGDAAPLALEDVRKTIRRVLVPVDLTAASSHQLDVAGRLADALALPLLLVHIIEPVRSILAAHGTPATVETERRYRAEADLERASGGDCGRLARRGAGRVWRAGGGDRESRQRPGCRADRHGAALVAGARAEDGFGHLPRALSGASARAGAAASASRRGWPRTNGCERAKRCCLCSVTLKEERDEYHSEIVVARHASERRCIRASVRNTSERVGDDA